MFKKHLAQSIKTSFSSTNYCALNGESKKFVGANFRAS